MTCFCNIVTIIIDARHLYKSETRLNHKGFAFEVYRSKGKWILDISDETKIELYGNQGEFEIPNQDYVQWLETRLMDLLTNK
jgi:hypothetical protein